jgi:uncharacterized protein (DUF2147 family)
MIAGLLAIAVQAAPTPASDIRGDWINERQTAIIRIADCGATLCGTVNWSASTAQRDAARGGTAHLEGTVVMFSFVPSGQRRWRGRLYLPDQNRTVKATIELRANDSLEVRGCAAGGLICKSQRWTRRSAD